jgi:hypothetical protein
VSFPAYLAVGVPPLPANVADLVSGVESDVVVEAVQWAARSLPVRPSMPILADPVGPRHACWPGSALTSRPETGGGGTYLRVGTPAEEGGSESRHITSASEGGAVSGQLGQGLSQVSATPLSRSRRKRGS